MDIYKKKCKNIRFSFTTKYTNERGETSKVFNNVVIFTFFQNLVLAIFLIVYTKAFFLSQKTLKYMAHRDESKYKFMIFSFHSKKI